MSTDARGLDSLAADLAPAVLEQVVAESRRRAAAILTDRLTDAIVEQALAGTEFVRTGVSARAPGREAPEEAPDRTPAGWYLYAIATTAAAAVAGRPGVEGAPVEILPAGELCAVVSPVPAGGRWGVDGRGEVDLESLAPRAEAHESVVEAALESGPVLPMRFGTMVSSREGLADVLASSTGELRERLEFLRGKREWGLRVERDPAGPVPLAGAAGGRDYLTRRRAERDEEAKRAEELAEAAEGIHARLADLAAGSVVHPAGGRGDGRSTVLKASYLVGEEDAAAFRRAAEAALVGAPAGLGLTGELTGPWPAYHFADVRLEGTAA